MWIELPNTIEILDYSTKFFYSKFILWFSVGLSTYYAITSRRDDKVYNSLMLYLLVELSLGLVDNIISPNSNISPIERSYFINYSNIIVALVEFNFYKTLYKKIYFDQNNQIIDYLWITLLAASTTTIIYTLIFNSNEILHLTYYLGTTEFLFLFSMSLAYFWRIFNTKSELSLFDRGSFWCFLGALFYCAISAPFYIVGPNFPTGEKTFDSLLPALLYYLPYSILFFCISKSLRCKTPIWS